MGTLAPSRTFLSFWMSGFEGAGPAGDPTGHLLDPAADYARLAQFGIRTVRESLGWRMAGDCAIRDATDVIRRALAARDAGMQVVWTLLGDLEPGEVDPFADAFPARFARLAGRAASLLREHTEGVPIYVPVNEPSYLAWAACQRPGTASFDAACARRLRRQFARAAILACEAVLEADPRARFVHADPVLMLAPADEDPDLERACASGYEEQFEVWDMITGNAVPGLGGSPRFVDYLGVNYYQTNQSEAGGKPLAWLLDDPRRAHLAMLLQSVYERYGLPMVIAETGHRGVRRGPWIREVADEVRKVRANGVPVEGICLYPAIDRPDRDNPARWLNCGLWDLEPAPGIPVRRLNVRYAQALHDAQRGLPRAPVTLQAVDADPVASVAGPLPAVFRQYRTAPGNFANTSPSSIRPRAGT